MMKRPALPMWLNLLFLAVCVSGCLTVYADAASGFTLSKPIVSRLFFKPPSVQIVDISLVQDSAKTQYVRAVVSIENIGENPVRGLGTIMFYDAEARLVAEGASNSTMIQPGSKQNFRMEVNWVSGAYLTDVATCEASFTPISEET